MTDLDITIELKKRDTIRKKLNAIRDDGMVPAVIHNHGKDSVLVMAPELELTKIYKQAGKHHPLQLKVGEQNFLALIKDAHFHPAKRRLEHLVFQAIRQDEKVEAEIPIHLEGEIPAEKTGLIILHQLDTVHIEALPRNLPDELKVDATKLVEVQDKITVADLIVPEGVTILEEADHPIATVAEAKVVEEPEPEVVEGEEGAEGETPEGEAGQTPEGEQAEASSKESAKE